MRRRLALLLTVLAVAFAGLFAAAPAQAAPPVDYTHQGLNDATAHIELKGPIKVTGKTATVKLQVDCTKGRQASVGGGVYLDPDNSWPPVYYYYSPLTRAFTCTGHPQNVSFTAVAGAGPAEGNQTLAPTKGITQFFAYVVYANEDDVTDDFIGGTARLG
jgi:hypothetical protein